MIVKASYYTYTTTLRLIRLLLFWHHSNVLVFAANDTFEGAVVCRHGDSLYDLLSAV